MTTRPRTKWQPEAVAVALERLLAAIRTGEMTASPSTALRIEGPIVALRLVAGSSPDEVVASLTDGCRRREEPSLPTDR